jgi:HSP20 family protein
MQMTLVRYQPFVLVNRLQRQLDDLFDETFARPAAADTRAVTWLPSVDVHEEADRFVVRADLPGVDAKDVDISVEKGVLTLRGERRAEKHENGTGYKRSERVAGTFLRRFTLPENVQTDAITARQTNGVLEVAIPKQPKAQPRRIEIQAA